MFPGVNGQSCVKRAVAVPDGRNAADVAVMNDACDNQKFKL